jgi:peptide/nickel transport system permease protein
LIAPVTILLIHVNWVLTGVVVVEYFFAFKGFGSLILEASLSRDINLLAGCTVVSILVAVVTQILADVAYAVLDPRIRLA